jgi:glutamate synthase (NADPH) small chain
MPKPPEQRAASTPWPLWPLQLRTESSHEEGGIRDWSINSVKFTGDENGNVKQLHAVASVRRPSSNPSPAPSSRSTSIWSCSPWASSARAQRHDRAAWPGARQPRQHRHHADYMTSVDGIFAAGDMRRGQSLVVWAISEGRKAAAAGERFSPI